jgi:hypothetical protein
MKLTENREQIKQTIVEFNKALRKLGVRIVGPKRVREEIKFILDEYVEYRYPPEMVTELVEIAVCIALEDIPVKKKTDATITQL